MDFVHVLVSIFHAFALIGVVVLAYGAMISSRLPEALQKYLGGLAFGCVAIVEIADSNTIVPGILVDLRSVPIALAGAFLGWRGALVAVSIAVLARLSLGGAGMQAGVAGTVIAAFAGLLWARFFPEKTKRPIWSFLLFGCLLSLSVVAVVFLPPSQRMNFLVNFGPGLTGLYVISCLVFGFMLEKERWRQHVGDEIRKHPDVDPKTGLYTAVAFEREYYRALQMGQTAQGIGLVLLRIEDLTWIARVWGQSAANQVLQSIWPRMPLEMSIRDVAGRVAEDKIALLMPDRTFAEAQRIGERLQQNMGRWPATLNGQGKVKVYISVGMSWSREVEDLDVALERAEAALLTASAEGRGRLSVATASEDQSIEGVIQRLESDPKFGIPKLG